jgi:hypothetical protein
MPSRRKGLRRHAHHPYGALPHGPRGMTSAPPLAAERSPQLSLSAPARVFGGFSVASAVASKPNRCTRTLPGCACSLQFVCVAARPTAKYQPVANKVFLEWFLGVRPELLAFAPPVDMFPAKPALLLPNRIAAFVSCRPPVCQTRSEQKSCGKRCKASLESRTHMVRKGNKNIERMTIENYPA